MLVNIHPGLLWKIALLLKEYAHKHDLAVVLTNHVHDCIEGEGRAAHFLCCDKVKSFA